MDLVVCEAPLDNSFQKGRRELVSKGSLGRRRKPSRTNLRLILSPADDRQDLGAFPNSDANFPRPHPSSPTRPREPAPKKVSLSNGDSSTKFQINNSNHRHPNRFQNSPLSVASDNYREVVASINQFNSLRSADFNGNSESDYHRIAGQSVEDYSLAVACETQQKVENGLVKPDLISDAKIQTNNVDIKSGYHGGKLLNGDYDVSRNGYHESDSLNANEFRSDLQTSNQQSRVAAKNQLNCVTFNNRRQITTTPVETKKRISSNGRYAEVTALQSGSTKLRKESSLPRTPREPSLVAEAQQFSIEAKLRRKKSEAHTRSAILIRTWERRTQAELWRRAPNGRFGDGAAPDSYICAKYKGSLQNGRSLGEMAVSSVRDVVSPDETMLYRVPGQRHRRFQEGLMSSGGHVAVNGHSPTQEPEWISLSKKLCAKFVEGHIEPSHSPDSYTYEEPEGVKPETPSNQQPKNPSSYQAKTPSGVTTPQSQVDASKKKKDQPTFCEESAPGGEPPWIHLSRKLCNKFIEEHIEYPTVTNGHLKPVPDLVEPNGDVRIIERVGKPKRHGTKQKKKESEPEWVSLSKKLRAKFIESHLDDPDTIALDNQLNVSDPEETGSETLSDVSQDLTVSKENDRPLEPVECRNYIVRTQVADKEEITQKQDQLVPDNSLIFPDKECCWEYQEMEFDQESNSGNFHEHEVPSEPLQEARIHRGTLPEDNLPQNTERSKFVSNENSQFIQNAECYNNDVKFLPLTENAATFSDSQEPSKLITVQFIAHSRNNNHNERENKNYVPYFSKTSVTGSHSNLPTWEEACYIEKTDELSKNENANSSKRVLSKSLDNLCDSLEPSIIIPYNDLEYNERRNSLRTTWNAACEDRILPGDSNIDTEFDAFFDTKQDIENPVDGNLGNVTNDTDKGILHFNSVEDSKKIQNNYENALLVESSSDDEVFECSPTSDELSSIVSKNNYGKISSRQSPVVEEEKLSHEADYEKVRHSGSYAAKSKNTKCNGVIPNSIYNGFSSESSSCSSQSTNNVRSVAPKEPVKLGMSKWITMSKSEQNLNKPGNTKLKLTAQKEYISSTKSSVVVSEMNGKEKKEGNERKINGKQRKDINQNGITTGNKNISKKSASPNSSGPKYANYQAEFREAEADENSSKVNGLNKEFDFANKCKSLCDISYSNNSFRNENGFNHHESVTDLSSSRQKARHPEIEFQHFASESEIPLCAKLVSKHDKRTLSKNARTDPSPKREESPSFSETSHVYEDMFKETPSGPSDSETSSWVMKSNTYYVNDRSCSMNDLDYSDSGSMSVKCDYASSSENSTLQSRHSSFASSSFYVNLRDYDSHMLEPGLNAGRKVKPANNGAPPSFSRSNPPTPESLRHLFTSPLSSIHSPPNRTARLLNRMPSDPQSHYYSTAAATSSAFKHGFTESQPKPKKAERSSSLKIKDIAQGIMLTFKKFQNHNKSPGVSSTQQVDVSHLAEMNGISESGKTKKSHKNSKLSSSPEKGYWNGGSADADSGFLSDVQRAKARRSSSDLTDMRSNSEFFRVEKKKGKGGKKNTNKDKKSRSKASDSRTVPTVSRKVQQMADGTLYLVTTVSGDTTMPGVYSDSPDTSSELSVHKSVKATGESNC